MTNAPVIIYNASREPVADLNNASLVGTEERINELSRAWFHLPVGDVHVSECIFHRYAEVYDGDRRVDLFRIVKKQTVNIAGKKYYRFDCEHVWATLQDPKLSVILYGSAGTETAIGEVLAEQINADWQLGTCDFDKEYLYKWQPGASLLKALREIPERFKCSYQWTFDTSSYPWTLNLVEPPTEVTAYIDYAKNLKSIMKSEDATQIFTRLYAYGAMAGEDQVDISEPNPTGEEYIDAATVATYGVIVKRWSDQRYDDADLLYASAVDYLAEYSIPRVTYTVDAAELYRLTGESIDLFELGALLSVIDPTIGIDVEVRIVSITRSNIDEAPGSVAIELGNKRGEFQFVGYVESNDLSQMDIQNIPGGVIGALPATPTDAGLYWCTDYGGYHDGTEWKTYMDIVGRLFAQHDDCYFRFDPTLGTLEIKGLIKATGDIQLYNDSEDEYNAITGIDGLFGDDTYGEQGLGMILFGANLSIIHTVANVDIHAKQDLHLEADRYLQFTVDDITLEWRAFFTTSGSPPATYEGYISFMAPDGNMRRIFWY